MKNILISALLLVLLLVVGGCAGESEDSYVDVAAPAFTLTSLEGENVALEELRGRVVVIHFGTSWCPFCRAEDPNLRALSEKYNDRGVEVLVVNVKEGDEKASEWYDAAGFSFPMLMDRDGTVAARYAPADAQPDLPRDEVMIASNLVLDREGQIRFFSLLDTRTFDAKLEALTVKLEEVLAEAS